MSREMSADFFMRDTRSATRIRAIVARVFSVPVSHVAIRVVGSETPYPADAEVLVHHFTPSLPGDFPEQYILAAESDRMPRLPATFKALARELDTAVLIGANPGMHLYLADGSVHTVELDQDETDAFHLPPEIRALIDRATPPVAVAL